MLLYIYDIKARNPREFNRVKRAFYYRLKKLQLPKSVWVTKSALVVGKEKEQVLDAFFEGFKGAIIGYKIRCEEPELFD